MGSTPSFIVAAIVASLVCGFAALAIMDVVNRVLQRKADRRVEAYRKRRQMSAAGLRAELERDVARAEKWVAILPLDKDWRQELETKRHLLRSLDEQEKGTGIRRVR